MATGTCRLCAEEAVLRKSHIEPEFFWRLRYERTAPTEPGPVQALIGTDGESAHVLQKGLRERLLCESCERVLGDLERRFADQWSQLFPPRVEGRLQLPLDYPLTKLLLLSVLWRASVSSLEYYEKVALGPYEPEIRGMLLAGDAGPVNLHPIHGVALVLPDSAEVAHGFAFKPYWVRAGARQRRCHFFALGGVLWFFHVGVVTESRGALGESGLPLFPYPFTEIAVAREAVSDRRFLDTASALEARLYRSSSR